MSPAANGRYDLILRGGSVIDGTGTPRRAADVAVTGDRIAAVTAPGGLDDAEAATVVDATGRIVAPGFIDVHTHDDRVLQSRPDMTMKTSQGVTTVVVGNCGISLAPLITDSPPPPLDLIDDGGAYRYERFGDFLDAVESAPPALNAAFLVGHSTLRVRCMDRLDRAATADEIAAMRAVVEDSLEAGAVGLSTGLFYATAAAAPTEEVIALAEPLKAAGALYATHMRDESDHVIESLEETFRIGREAGVPVLISHHKVVGRHNFGRSRETLPLIEQARRGQRVDFDVYPYRASSTVLRAEGVRTAERTLITWSKAMPEATGRDLAELAAEAGVSIEEMMDRLQPAGAIYFSMDEDDVRRILQSRDAIVASDGLPLDERPHPRLWGTFPRVLGHYARDEGLMSLEEAVRRMTLLPASRFGLADRGRLSEGAHADIVVFNADTVVDRADFDDPTHPADGIDHVFVNGAEVYRELSPTGARPGRVLRRGRDAMPAAG